MLGLQLLMIMLMGQVPEDPADPDALVPRLGASRYADREAASEELVRLGRPALSALRAARTARDPEVRNRASNLVQKIEGSLLTQPTLVQLDFEHAPLTDVIRSLSQQAGFKVGLYPDNLPKWKRQRVTLKEREPVPFWKAIDLVCDAAWLQQTPGLHGIAGPREPTFGLTDGPARTLTPNYDHGPFRISLVGVHYQSDLNYGATGIGLVGGFGQPLDGAPRPVRAANLPRGRINPVTSVQFTAHLLIAAEPRLFISQSGALQITEAVDNRGHSLMAQTGDSPNPNRLAGYSGVMGGSVLQLQAQLHRPATPGETIKKLRGVIPLSISSRGPDPLVVPLDKGNVGKSFANADVQVTLHTVRTIPTSAQTLLEVSVKSNDRAGPAENADSDAFGDVYRHDMHRQQLEIIDSRGRLVSWFPSGVDSETSRLTLQITSSLAGGPLKELRYYTLTRATVDVPFEFTDIPMP
jgi:hypothetical protein